MQNVKRRRTDYNAPETAFEEVYPCTRKGGRPRIGR
jgi:hypothetical protein